METDSTPGSLTQPIEQRAIEDVRIGLPLRRDAENEQDLQFEFPDFPSHSCVACAAAGWRPSAGQGKKQSARQARCVRPRCGCGSWWYWRWRRAARQQLARALRSTKEPGRRSAPPQPKPARVNSSTLRSGLRPVVDLRPGGQHPRGRKREEPSQRRARCNQQQAFA